MAALRDLTEQIVPQSTIADVTVSNSFCTPHCAKGLLMNRIILSGVALMLCFSSVAAQDAPGLPGAVPEHKMLKRFVGKWKTVSEAFEDGKPTFKAEGTMTGNMMGEFWLLSETKAGGAGFEMKALQTIGYDASKKKYVGTWIDTMVNHMWQYEGDAEGDKLVLNTEGPNYMTDGSMAKFRDVYEFVSDDEIRTSSEIWQDDKWIVFMKGSAKRMDDK
ncbi:MAG: DUF1579 domain-containing protein [Fuerstiella sp.]